MYKMNRYGMPFVPFVGMNNHRQTTIFACAIISSETKDTYVWVLQTFLKAMCQKRPKGVITDGNATMIKSIGEVFVGVWHRVCSWHIEKNMKKHFPQDVLNEFKTLLYYTTTEAIFEVRWRAFVQK
jgi:zinc finger SWIM domain-containing protein 3